MSFFSLQGISITSIAAAVPSQIQKNINYSHISEAERNFLIKTTGIEERRIVNEKQTTSDLCEAAANALFTQNAIQPKEIGLLIFVSQSPDYYLPATAAVLQRKLNLPKTTMAFDIGLGCSGYVYGLTVAASLMRTANIKYALLLAGDASSVTCPPEDKSTHPLFGDAGSATLLTQTANTSSWYGNLFTDGSGAESIMIHDGCGRNKINPTSFDKKKVAEGIVRDGLSLILDGQEIFAFSVREVPPSINDLLHFANTNIEQIDYSIMHQANKLINETVRKKLKLLPEKVPYSLNKFGNTSSASIPLTMVTQLAKQLKQPQKLLLSGFGVGFSWGNLLIESNEINCLPLIEI